MICGPLQGNTEIEKWRGELERQTLPPSKLSQGRKKEKEKEKHTDCCSLFVAAP